MKKLDVKEGDRYGRLTIVALLESKNRRRMVRATCFCGKEKDYLLQSLVSGCSLSCGCLRSELLIEKTITHGMSNSKAYDIWSRIKHKEKEICGEWFDFKEFYSDMGDKPDNMKLARIDKSQPYSKENCSWVWRSEKYKRRMKYLLKA